MDLIPKPRTLKKVQLRDISWNLTPPTPAHGPRCHFIKAFFTPQYSRENVGISRIDLHCQKPLNSLNLMVFLKFSISHYKWSKSAVKSGRFWDRGRLAGVWRSSVWQGFSATVGQSWKVQRTCSEWPWTWGQQPPRLFLSAPCDIGLSFRVLCTLVFSH